MIHLVIRSRSELPFFRYQFSEKISKYPVLSANQTIPHSLADGTESPAKNGNANISGRFLGGFKITQEYNYSVFFLQ